MTAPNATVTSYQYDAGGKISRITTGANWAEYNYDTSGRRIGLLYSNGVRAAYTWNARNQLASLVWYTPTNTVIRSWSYGYDPAGRRISAQLNDGSIAWSYDAMGRLTSESIVSTLWGNHSGAWTYDAVGNRLDAGATFGLDHRQTGIGAESISYDSAGNATSVNGEALNYDAHNRLLQTATQEFRYNALGQLDQITVKGAKTYVHDGENPLVILNGNVFSHRYTFGLRMDEPLFAQNGSASRFYVTDEQGSVFAVTDQNGGLMQQYAYDAWGNRVFFDSVISSGLGASNYNPFEFQGKERLNGLDLYHSRARVYRPSLGRFLQKDPARGSSFHPASRHPYQFALNRPTQYTDPTGRSATQYGLMIKENDAAEYAGVIIGFANAFGGTNLGFLGNFLDRRLQFPNESIAASASYAVDAVTQDMETVLDEFEEWFDDDGASIAAGLATGAGYGVTAGTYWVNWAVQGILPF